MSPGEIVAVLAAGVLFGVAVALWQQWAGLECPQAVPLAPPDLRAGADLAGDVEAFLRREGY